MGKSVEYKNNMYPSLKALYRFLIESGSNEISYQVFYSRYSAGWEMDQLLTTPVNDVCIRNYMVGDKVFPSLKDLAEAAQISYDAAVKRRNRGYTDNEIFYGKKPKKLKDKILKIKESKLKRVQVVILGQSYNSLADAYYAFKPTISMNTFRGRIRWGWSPEEALGLVEKVDGRAKKKIVIEIDNATYCLKDASVEFEVPVTTIHNRLKRGATHKQAVGLDKIKKYELLDNRGTGVAKRERKKINLIYNGIQYYSIASLANACGLDHALLYERLNRNKWCLEKAIKTPVRGQVHVAGQVFQSELSAFKKIGKVNFSTYMSRHDRGHSLEICLGLEPMPRTIKQNKNMKISEMAAENNLSFAQLHKRMKEMTLEEAIKYKPVKGKYNHTVFARKPQLANSPGFLYFITLNTNKGILHKIGITKSFASRFRNNQIHSVKAIIQGKLIDVYNLEQRILKEFVDNSYEADKSFEGRTETLLLIDSEEKCLLELLEHEVINNPAVFQVGEV